MVLLKNDRETLPLNKNISSVAVIGPLANDGRAPLGWWAGDGKEENTVTPLLESRQRSHRRRWFFTRKAVMSKTSRLPVLEAVNIAKQADVALLFVGETHDMVGEAASLFARSSRTPDGTGPDATGKPTIVVLVNGRPLSIGDRE